MKKAIYLLLVVFAIEAPKTVFAQTLCNSINSIQGPTTDPCVGADATFVINRNDAQAGTFNWERLDGGSLPLGFNVDPDGNVYISQVSTADEGTYKCTFYGTTGCSDIGLVDLVVTPNPNASYTTVTKCNSVTLVPHGGASYLSLDQNGEYTVPFDSLYLTGTGILFPGGGFRAFNASGCYSDVTIGQISANPLTLTLVPTKWRIKAGQSSTLTAGANWPVVTAKTKWFKNTLLFCQGVNQVTVTDTGSYRVQMRATMASGNCVKSKTIRIQRPVGSVRIGDEDGSLEAIEGQESILDLQVGPNPASDQVQISGYDQDIEIFDINGRTIQTIQVDTFEGNNKPQIVDVHSLPNGIYLIRSGEQTTKLVVEK